MKDLYTENYKRQMKEVKGHTNKWKDSPHYGSEDLILLNCPYYPKQSTNSMLSPQNLNGIFYKNEKKS